MEYATFWGARYPTGCPGNCVPPNPFHSTFPARGKCNFCTSVSGQAPFCAVKWNEITKKSNKESEKRVIKCTTDKSTNMKKIIPNLKKKKKQCFQQFSICITQLKFVCLFPLDLFVGLNHQKIDSSSFCFTFCIISFSCGITFCLNYLHTIILWYFICH